MVSSTTLIAFALVSLAMVCSPGPNMVYLISRSITQGKRAGVISLLGVVAGFVFYVIATMLGLSAIFKTVPVLYLVVKWSGALYLLWLAWNTIKPGGKSVFTPQSLSIDSPKKLFLMGFVTNILNPKIAIMYASLLPQFIDIDKGSVLLQGSLLGMTQITISFMVNLLIVLIASKIYLWFSTRHKWLLIQRWLMASVLSALAVRLAFDRK